MNAVTLYKCLLCPIIVLLLKEFYSTHLPTRHPSVDFLFQTKASFEHWRWLSIIQTSYDDPPSITLLIEWYIALVMMFLAPGTQQMLPIVFLRTHSTDVFSSMSKGKKVTGSHRNPLMFSPVTVQPSPDHFYLKAPEATNTQHGSN